MRFWLPLATAAIIWLQACSNLHPDKVIRDTTITAVTSFNNLFLDSLAVNSFLRHHQEYAGYENQMQDFYKERNYEYAWFDSSGLGEQAGNFMNLLNNTIANLQDSNLYNRTVFDSYSRFAGSGLRHKEKDVLNTELLLTGQFFHFADRIYKGTDSNIASLGWFIPRRKVDLKAILDSVIASKSKSADAFSPLNEQYKKLQLFIPAYYRLQKYEWDSIPAPVKAIHPGDVSRIVPEVKERLSELGDLPVNDSSRVYDTALLPAVRQFQKRMGLVVDGIIGSKMIDELNVSPAERIQQIFVNLERLRWMPLDNAPRRIFVNIPEYRLYVFDSGEQKLTMNVIVGTAANSTVIFSDKLKYIVFSPYWHVPAKIVRTEILPAMKKDTGYLRKHNMVRLGGRDTLPVIRQNPGPDNALGKVKFLFPNSYDIYLHDTPNRDLFSAASRSLSHGCIRVGDPKRLADFLLENDTSWNAERIDTSMEASHEIWVTLPQPVPVIIGYFTAWVDKDGLLNFRKDIYGHDGRLADKLFVKQ